MIHEMADYWACEDDAPEHEEPAPERKPARTFTDRQTLLVNNAGKLAEFPMGGDEYHTGQPFTFHAIGGVVYGYVLNRRPEYAHKFYGWALPRNGY